MRVVVQRVLEASVLVNAQIVGSIGRGLLVFVGIEQIDTPDDVIWLCSKIARLRIFGDADNVMNLSVRDISGEVLVVSQFTLHAQTKKGNRPSYIRSARPQHALVLYETFLGEMSSALGKEVAAGEFGADMKVSLINDGPVTILIDSRNRE
ncbi:MAG: D-tyrosyl-tRNA(Tyr) deacylase [Chitinophagaceae bacterium]|nr:MAG: D-tyrosyl-tRNA(Tyr) deacylase [Chitinophagaceae bacterium]